MNPIYMGAIRHAAQAFAGSLVARGVIHGDAVELIVGAVTSVAALAWFLYTNRQR